ncbi:hypothetical protein QE152_g35924 [Popillia japonica]|uniref:Uncharacterized protein n=1 Tax=Popillia japonica TaxID=7064 RepID=A0AAW1IEU1_POPJA
MRRRKELGPTIILSWTMLYYCGSLSNEQTMCRLVVHCFNKSLRLNSLDKSLAFSPHFSLSNEQTMCRFSSKNQSAILAPAKEDKTYLELQRAVTKFNTPCTLDEFLNINNDVVVCEILTDKDIVQVYLPDNNNNDNDDHQEESKFGEPPSAGEAYAACRILPAYQLTDGKPINSNFDEMYMNIEHQFFKEVTGRKKQTLITHYFTN